MNKRQVNIKEKLVKMYGSDDMEESKEVDISLPTNRTQSRINGVLQKGTKSVFSLYDAKVYTKKLTKPTRNSWRNQVYNSVDLSRNEGDSKLNDT